MVARASSVGADDENAGDDDLVVAVLNVLAEPALSVAADSALLGLQAALTIEWACVYFVRRDEGTFLRVSEYGDLPAYVAEPSFLHPDLAPTDDPLAQCVATTQPTVLQRTGRFEVAEPIVLGQQAVGLLLFGFGEAENERRRRPRAVDLLLSALAASFDRSVTQSALTDVASMTFRFAWHPDSLSDGLAAAVTAARMSHGLLLDSAAEGTRRLLAQTGFRVVDLDLDGASGSLVDRLCVESARQGDLVAMNVNRATDSRYPFRSGVAVPLSAGREPAPTLVLGAPIHYNYPLTDLAVFRSIGDLMSATLMATIDHGEILIQHAHAAVAITALEIAQSARHEARNLIGAARELVAVVAARVDRHDYFGAAQGLNELDDVLAGVNSTIDNIRSATRPPTRVEQSVELQGLFNAACSQVRGRLQSLHVGARYDGARVVVRVYEDWMRQVFLNLLLNSLDAFEEARRKSRREIGLLVSPLAPSDAYLTMRFFDTATGIQRRRGDQAASGAKVPWDEAIFEAGYSTKEGGSGYGLHLCRTIMADHGGSIRLIDSRGGTTFELLLPSSRATRLAD